MSDAYNLFDQREQRNEFWERIAADSPSLTVGDHVILQSGGPGNLLTPHTIDEIDVLRAERNKLFQRNAQMVAQLQLVAAILATLEAVADDESYHGYDIEGWHARHLAELGHHIRRAREIVTRYEAPEVDDARAE